MPSTDPKAKPMPTMRRVAITSSTRAPLDRSSQPSSAMVDGAGKKRVSTLPLEVPYCQVMRSRSGGTVPRRMLVQSWRLASLDGFRSVFHVSMVTRPPGFANGPLRYSTPCHHSAPPPHPHPEPDPLPERAD